jgi:hypothetical protein
MVCGASASQAQSSRRAAQAQRGRACGARNASHTPTTRKKIDWVRSSSNVLLKTLEESLFASFDVYWRFDGSNTLQQQVQ